MTDASYSSQKDSKRDKSIDTLRGIACLLLVFYHVVGSDPSKGLRLESGALRELNDALAAIRMPLFTFLSGYVYAARPFNGNWPAFLGGKVRRLIYPMLTVGTVFAIFQAALPSSNSSVSSWYTLHLIPVGHFWFIEALFLVFMATAALESRGLMSTKRQHGLCLLASTCMFISPISSHWLSISGAIYLAPFFIIGSYIRRFGFSQPINMTTSVAALAAVFALMILENLGYINIGHRRTIFSLLIGSAFCVAALFIRPQIKPLAKIGAYSYSIYLLHVFFTAGSRLSLKLFSINDTNSLVAIGVMAGISGPVLTELAFRRSQILSIYVLGQGRRSPA